MHSFNHPPYVEPPPRNKKTLRTVLLVLLGVVVLFFVGCSVLVGVTADKVDKAAKNTSGPEFATPPTVSGSPSANAPASPGKVTGTGTCDVDLGSGDGTDYSLTAEVDLRNSGDTGSKVMVLVSWPQYGHSPVGDGKVVTVPAHGSQTINFAKHATMSEIDRAQTYQEKHDYNLDCSYKVITSAN